jgi:hypothetical protein
MEIRTYVEIMPFRVQQYTTLSVVPLSQLDEVEHDSANWLEKKRLHEAGEGPAPGPRISYRYHSDGTTLCTWTTTWQEEGEGSGRKWVIGSKRCWESATGRPGYHEEVTLAVPTRWELPFVLVPPPPLPLLVQVCEYGEIWV